MAGLHEQASEPVAKRQRKADHDQGIDVPDDVLEEILLRLPVKSLLRFRSVCKSWYGTISGPHFERRQVRVSGARRPSMLLLPFQLTPWTLRMDKIRFFAYPGHGAAAELVHERLWSTGISRFDQPIHCDGLLLVSALNCPQIFVCNPATKELVVLPTGSPDYGVGGKRVGFGVDPSTGKYKVVRCFHRYYNGDYTDYSVGCEIFTLGSRSWKPAPVDPPYLIKSMSTICLPGAIYWSAGVDMYTQTMLRFDLRDEEFTVFPTPPGMELQDHCSNLAGLAGKLCYAHVSGNGNNVALWMAEDDGVQTPKWSLHATIVLPWATLSVIPFSAYGQGIYLCLGLRHIYRYSTECKALERVANLNQEMTYYHPHGTLNPYIPGGSDWLYCAVQYSETLVSIRGHLIE